MRGSSNMLKVTKSKKELKRIDWKIVKRLVIFLHYNSKTKKTALAMKCNMSYDKCILYLDWPNEMKFINKEIDENGSELIRLSDKGTKIYELLNNSNDFKI